MKTQLDGVFAASFLGLLHSFTVGAMPSHKKRKTTLPEQPGLNNWLGFWLFKDVVVLEM